MANRRQVVAAWGLVAVAVAMMLFQGFLARRVVAKSPTVEDLAIRVAALEAKLACVTAASSTTDVFFEGCNVHVQNGLGSTSGSPTNSFGNLILGYNEGAGLDRNGSHNLVIGQGHSYASYGGLVAGSGNTVSGPNASVAGGSLNMATAANASVSGGRSNQAISPGASVSGGTQNIAGVSLSVGQDASVSGGFQNVASGFASSVSGGSGNEASANRASVSGGSGCTLSGSDEWGAIPSGGVIGDC